MREDELTFAYMRGPVASALLGLQPERFELRDGDKGIKRRLFNSKGSE